MTAIPGNPVLDHLALASHRSWDQLDRYCRQLGGRWLGGPTDPTEDPFYFCQVEFAGGTTLEFIEPYPGQGSDFIRRFLDRNGPGPHHLTFKVTDIDAVMGSAEAAGYQIVNASLDDPGWKEAFLHPKQSHGIVIQLAQPGPDSGWVDPPPLPPTDQGEETTIDRVVHLVADLDRAVALFTGVLGMEAADPRPDPTGKTVELTSGPFTLALVSPADGPARHWLGDRGGRLLQVEFSVAHLGLVSDLRPYSTGYPVEAPTRYELPPDKNLGTRLVLSQRPRHAHS